MPDATTFDPNINPSRHVESTISALPSTKYSCTACQVFFQDGREQRIHMKEEWHLENIKRRMESLPPVTRYDYETPVENKSRDDKPAIRNRIAKVIHSSDSESSDSDDNDQSAWPFQCLFCSEDFALDDAGFATNLEHMSTAHGMSIPDAHLVDMQSFIGYLATEVRAWHECLYCGAAKHSTNSIQSHMRDKGHCRLNFDREPELLDFWDKPSSDDEIGGESDAMNQEQPTDLSTTEKRFASGKIISSRNADRDRRRTPTRPEFATTTSPQSSLDQAVEAPLVASISQLETRRQVANRMEMSLLGVSSQQRQALVLAEKRAQRSEDVACRARDWVYAKTANFQEHDQVDGKRKHGKQNHKLQPR